MALITPAAYAQANQYLDNYLQTGHYQGRGPGPAQAAAQSPEMMVAHFWAIGDQMGLHGSTHISTGTGGVLVALLARFPDKAKAREMASQILHQNSITLTTGQVVRLGGDKAIDTSPCSNAALADFIASRGVFAGRA
jgi:hypothetical protein